MRTSLARFPFVKGLDSFDFGYQPSVDGKQIQKLSLCHFVEHGENLVLLGPPGVGKTHLAVGLGLKAIEHGYRVLFTTVATMLSTLTKALSEGRFDDKLKVYTIPRLLIIDEILTSNQSFGSWGDCLRRPRDRQRHPRPDPASRHDDQYPGRLLPVEGQAEVRGGQTDDGGNVSDSRPAVHPGVGNFFDDRRRGF